MKILHLGKYFPPERGGMEAVLKSFSEATGSFIENYCLVADRRGKTRVESFGSTTVHYLRQTCTFLLAPVLPSLPFVLRRLRRYEQFDVILLHYPNPMAMLALFLLLLTGKKREKIVIWNHADVLLEERWKRALYAFFRPIEEFVFRRVDAFVAATPNHASSSDTFRRFTERTCVIPYALQDSWFVIDEKEKEAAARACERIGGPFLLFVGRLVPYKGLSTLVCAADRIPCRIAIVGAGPLEQELEKEIKAKGLSDRVLLLGEVEDIRPYFLACEFFVLPSVSGLEGFGIVQIEAMALGKPVVCSDLPTGVTYVNAHGETGLVFPVGDDAALAEACGRLLSDQEFRERLGKNARDRTLRMFSYKALASAAATFFDRLLERDT
ncbi:MAG: glycosyltransferase [Syntrophorhabdaceae bacterium]|nr:glycosyltransferase [Syntrophorhabdaceae bacterium]